VPLPEDRAQLGGDQPGDQVVLGRFPALGDDPVDEGVDGRPGPGLVGVALFLGVSHRPDDPVLSIGALARSPAK
jgi:hypothetical protein